MAEYSYDVRDKKSHIFISTYSNLKSKFDPKEGEMSKSNEWLKKMPWGLVVFDEAQWLPA
jgi:SNF2 family DNA or RNA helicase